MIILRKNAENNSYICRKVLSAEHETAVGEAPGGHAVDECKEVADMVRERNVHGKRSQKGDSFAPVWYTLKRSVVCLDNLYCPFGNIQMVLVGKSHDGARGQVKLIHRFT